MKGGTLSCLVLLLVGCTSGPQVLATETDASLPFVPTPDELWFGGPAYYERWENGISSDPNYFPILVWLQNPDNAERHRAVGINLYMGLWQGPTAEKLAAAESFGMTAISGREGEWARHVDDPTITGWLQLASPDNAQELADGGFGTCIEPEVLQASYADFVSSDATRPVMLELGRGAAMEDWVGRGPCLGRVEMYPEYVKAGDLLSFHVYPVTSGWPLELMAMGVDNLRTWSNGEKPVFPLVEASNIEGNVRPTPEQIRAEVWLSLIHGANGIAYFCHAMEPNFNETDCLDHEPTAAALTAINEQLITLAPVLNTAPLTNLASATPADVIDLLVKRHGGSTYVFAIAKQAVTNAEFVLQEASGTRIEVIDENRTLDLAEGTFSDSFDAYEVHLYRAN